MVEEREVKKQSLWAIYGVVGLVSLVASHSALLNSFTGDFFATWADSPDRTGIFLIDYLVSFTQAARSNPASSALLDSTLCFGLSVSLSVLAESSRRRVSVPQVVVGFYLLVAEWVGFAFMLSLLLAMLNRCTPRAVGKGQPSFQVHIMRAMYLVLSNVLFVALFFVISPAMADENGNASVPVVALAFALPALPLLSFAMDSTARGAFETSIARNGQVSDRQLAHVLIMFNSALSAAVGLFIHLRFISRVFLYDEWAEFADEMLANGPCVYVLINFVGMVLSSYVWLQLEASAPVQSYFASTNFNNSHANNNKGGSHLLSWRDFLAVLIFGPTCHFAVAFAAREFGLFKLDNLRLKSN